MTAKDAERYDKLTRTTYAQIYPVIASQILERTGICNGICVDIGSGPGPLSIALTLQSDLFMIALDTSPKMQKLLWKNSRLRDLTGQICPAIGDVHTIPLKSGSCDLVVSRGSYHFWNNLSGAFKEIYRVLKEGGIAYIGGGYGSSEIRDAINRQKQREMPEQESVITPGMRFRKYGPGEVEDAIRDASIDVYRIINDESGFWMVFSR